MGFLWGSLFQYMIGVVLIFHETHVLLEKSTSNHPSDIKKNSIYIMQYNIIFDNKLQLYP